MPQILGEIPPQIIPSTGSATKFPGFSQTEGSNSAQSANTRIVIWGSKFHTALGVEGISPQCQIHVKDHSEVKAGMGLLLCIELF